jgi:hypothetical protein
MKYLIFLLGFVSILMTQSFTACDQTTAPTITDPEFLLNCWIHVHEEVVEEGRYFQPCDFPDLPDQLCRGANARWRAARHDCRIGNLSGAAV